MLRNGDCSNCTESPWRSVPSNTGSPVELAKSASTTVSFSVSSLLLREKNRYAPVATATSRRMARTKIHLFDLVGRAMGSAAIEVAPEDPWGAVQLLRASNTASANE